MWLLIIAILARKMDELPEGCLLVRRSINLSSCRYKATKCYTIPMSTYIRPRVAVFASGSGSTFQAVAGAVADGLVDFDIVLVISNKADAGVLERVAKLNQSPGFDIKTEIINQHLYPGGPQQRGQTLEEVQATLDALQRHKVDHLSLMGCMRIINTKVIEEWGWRPEYAQRNPDNRGVYLSRMTNTHPGILPATTDTYGIHTQEKVLELGLKETAQTLHVVATGVDEGPVLAENRVKVYAPQHFPPELADTPQTLFDRVQRIEKARLPLDLDYFLKQQYLWRQQHK